MSTGTAAAWDLVDEVEAAHGAGLLAATENINASFSSGGLAFATKGQSGGLSKVEASLSPVQQRMTLIGRVPRPWTVDIHNGDELDRRLRCLRSGARRLRWSPEDLGTFAAAALWTYLTMPLLLRRAQRLEHLPDAAGLRRLRIELPESLVGHSHVQTLHIDADGLIRRHDYTATAFGSWARAAQTVSAYKTFDGVPIGTSRHVTPRLGRPMPGPTLVWIDIHSFRLRG